MLQGLKEIISNYTIFFTNYTRKGTLKYAISFEMSVYILGNFVKDHTSEFHNDGFITF